MKSRSRMSRGASDKSDRKRSSDSEKVTTTEAPAPRRKPTLGARPTLGLGGGVHKTPVPNRIPFATLSPERARQHEIEQYYKNYDAMDGLVTAIVLGGFFAFVCLLVIYKTKCKPMW